MREQANPEASDPRPTTITWRHVRICALIAGMLSFVPTPPDPITRILNTIAAAAVAAVLMSVVRFTLGKRVSSRAAIFLIAVVCIAIACAVPLLDIPLSRMRESANDSTPASKTTRFSTDITKLAGLCSLPQYVTAAQWQTLSVEDGILGPSDWHLVARLTFSPEGVRMLDEELVQTTGKPLIVQPPEWLAPDTLPTALDSADTNIYAADMFFKSPLLNGYILRPRPDTIILVLYTM